MTTVEALLLIAVKNLLRDLYRPISEQRQMGEFREVLDRLADTVTSKTSYAEDGVRAALTAKGAHRRPLRAENGKIVIAGFGSTDSWQTHGLWPAFEALCEFHLVVIPHERLPEAASDEHERTLKAERFLSVVDRLGNVACAFFYHAGRHISDGLLQELHERGIWTVIMALDDQRQFSFPRGPFGEPHQLRVARQCDIYWTTWKQATLIVKHLGGNPWYAGMASSPAVYRPMNARRDLDVVFIGGKYGWRGELIAYLLRRGLKVHAFGTGWPNAWLEFDDIIRLYSRAKIVLGVGSVGSMGTVRCLKGRDFEAPMCGALYLTSYFPGLCDFFVPGSEVLCYSSKEECEEQVVWALSHPDECEQIRNAARARALRDHTWRRRLATMWGLFP